MSLLSPQIERRCALSALGTRLAVAPLLLAAVVGCRPLAFSQNNTGVQQFQQGNYQAALQSFHQTVARDPGNADAYYNLASTYHRLGKVTNRRGDLDQAEQYYHQCLDRNPNHADCHRGLAVLLVDEQRNEEAFRLLEGWASRNPTASPPRVELARLSQEFGDPNRAKEYLLQAVSANPYDARALAALGKLHEDLGDPAQALADYQRSLWHDSAQPAVAARVAALRGAYGNIAPITTPPGGTRTVTVPTQPLR